jgi:protein ImuB
VLWLALYLPELPLQLVQRASPDKSVLVITDGASARPIVFCASDAARAVGIRPGMAVAAAKVFASHLIALPRDPDTESRAMHNFACWGYQFTPGVVVQRSEGLVLEIGSALQLHGGLPSLLELVRQGTRELGYHSLLGVAPTPIAAWVTAKAQHLGCRAEHCLAFAALPDHLGKLPLALLDWPENVLAQLSALGVTRIGQCLALPRDGFIKRFGHDFRMKLDQAIGEAPDPRSYFTPPDTFTSRVDFGFEVADVMALLFPLKRLLLDLEGFLRGHGAGIQYWYLTLEHTGRRKTRHRMGVVRPERDANRLLDLARERLTKLEIKAPTLAIQVEADQLFVFDAHSESWLPDPKRRDVGWGHLIDKLTSRLGAGQVYRVHSVDGHRPERCWRQVGAASPDTLSTAIASSQRPLWLLRKARSLPSEDGQPRDDGRLHLISGPERIESGWWDGKPAARDYYVARNPRGETLWIYREHGQSEAWYLHGIFA